MVLRNILGRDMACLDSGVFGFADRMEVLKEAKEKDLKGDTPTVTEVVCIHFPSCTLH